MIHYRLSFVDGQTGHANAIWKTVRAVLREFTDDKQAGPISLLLNGTAG